jgi:small subunit ribosomal protein S20
MANKKASLKSARQTVKRTVRNRIVMGRLRTQLKKVLTLGNGVGNAGTVDGATQESAREYISLLDKAAKSGVIHRNKVSRHKSTMAKFVF